MLGADLGLALTYASVRERALLAALFAIDRAMGDVVRTTREPLLGPVRLAWWRERLEDLDAGISAPAEPRLVAVERHLLPREVTGHDLSSLEAGWLRLFDPFPWSVETSDAIRFRGNLLFGLGAKVLAVNDDRIESAGGLWALTDAARHCSDGSSRALLLDQARTFARALGGEKFPTALRPLSVLAAVAIRDCRQEEPLEAEGTPGRAATMLRHRFTGALPRP